jgi:hypothetical protein
MAVAGLLGAVLILDLWCRTARAAWPAVTAAALTMLIGLLAKESVATALPVLSIYLCRVRQVRARALLGPWLAVGVFLALRVSALSGLQASGSGTGQRVEALRNLPVLIVDGLRALITLEPVGIRHLYWDYRDVGWAMSLVAAVTVALLAAIAWASRRRMPLIPTALGVMICMMAPIALIATVPGWGGYGRYLYLPLAFGLLATAEWGRWLQTSLATHVPKFLPVLPVVVIVFFCFELVGLRQAFDTYRSQESLARASTELQPHAPDGWEWLGNHYLEVGDLDNAVRCYANAVAIEPSIYRPRHNLAAALLYLGRPAEALEHETAIESIHGITAQGAFVAARACLDLGRWREAGRWLERGLEHEPDNRRLLELRARWEAGRPGADSSPPPG